MPLPVLHSRDEPSRDDLIRLFHQTDNRWVQHLADEEHLDIGTAYANPDLSQVYDANHIRDVSLPTEFSPEQAEEMVQKHFAARRAACAYWMMNPSASQERTAPMVEYLLSRGYRPSAADIMLLGHIPPVAIPQIEGLKIIPARASFRHAHTLFEEAAQRYSAPQLADASMLHLDDPHWDSLLALKDGEPAAHAGVLAVGEIGRIDEFYVAERFRGQGLGTIMMSRILEICARSLFRHVMLSVLPDNTRAIALYTRIGFRKVGEAIAYFSPSVMLA